MHVYHIIHIYIHRTMWLFPYHRGTHADPAASIENRDRRREINSSHRNGPRQRGKLKDLDISGAALQLAVAVVGPTKCKNIQLEMLCASGEAFSQAKIFLPSDRQSCPQCCYPTICHVSSIPWSTIDAFPAAHCPILPFSAVDLYHPILNQTDRI